MPKKRTAPEKPASPARKRAGAAKTALSRERIEEAALTLIEQQGLEGFSLRKLAEALGCEAMSLYNHFPSKAHILDALVDRLIGSMEAPAPEADSMEKMQAIARAWRQLAHRHPRFFPFLALHRMNSATGLAFLERIMQTLQEAGFEPETAARLFRTVNYYLIGAALDETAGYGNGPSSLNPVSDDEVARTFPAIAAAGRFFSADEHERTFTFGLLRLLGTLPEQ